MTEIFRQVDLNIHSPEEDREREDAFEIYTDNMSDPNDPDYYYDMFRQDKPENNSSATPKEYNE